MAFDNMPDLGPMLLPGANEYGREFTDLARLAAKALPHEMDISYGPDKFHTLDVWCSANQPAQGAPVVIFIHGGAFRNGHKEWIGAMAPAITAIPAVLVSPNYRLVPRARVADAVDDCFEALAWVYRNISRFGGNPENLFVGGHSAGGHLATMLALRTRDLAKRGIPQSAVRACAPLSAVFSMRREEHSSDSLVSRFWDQMIGSAEAAVNNTASTFACESKIPFYISRGDDEPSEVVAGTEEMIGIARENGFLFDTDRFQACDHFEAHRRTVDPNGIWMTKLRAMIADFGS
jgi:arylformamidase